MTSPSKLIGVKRDHVDLVPLVKFELDKYFYLKNDDGSYSTCIIYAEELKNEERAVYLRAMTKQFMAEGKLFVNRNNPGGTFE